MRIFSSVWKEWLHCHCSIKPKSESIHLSVCSCSRDTLSEVFLLCVYLCVLCMQRKRKTDRERRRGGAVCNKWKFHFPCLSSLSQQLVSVRVRPFFLRVFSSYMYTNTLSWDHTTLYVTALPMHCARNPPQFASQVWVMKDFHLPLKYTFLCIWPSSARLEQLSSRLTSWNIFFHYRNYWRDRKWIEAWPCSWPWIKYGIHKEDHPCELNQAHLGYVKGVCVWYFDWHKSPTSHICSWKVLLSLSMSSPPSDPSVLIRPSCRVFSFLSFSSFPLMGGGKGKKQERKSVILSCVHNEQFQNLSDPLSFSLGFLFPLIYLPHSERGERKSDKRQ